MSALQQNYMIISYNKFFLYLSRLIKSYTERIKFCLDGSKRTFGLVKGSNVAVLVDTSDVNTGFGRLSTFKESLLVRKLPTHLIGDCAFSETLTEFYEMRSWYSVAPSVMSNGAL